jgi:arylsulfatase/arylsulfatase A
MKKIKHFLFCINAVAVLLLTVHAKSPNIVIVMTDDQGYGDFGAVGNEVIETPHIDAMADRSVGWEEFYVSPVCSPTRASLMTGRYNHRTRCIDTYLGRSMMATEEVTMAEILREAGYATGIFGKWHLGDNYPMRATDQGFDEALVHRGGGIGQPADPRGGEGKYTDPILFHNNQEQLVEGYCTDIFFDYALDFIDQAQEDDKPFFAYIACNAPHVPLHDVPEDLLAHYKAKEKEFDSIMVGKVKNLEKARDDLARIAAMITNVDENVGRLFEELKERGLYKNTIVIYLNDNGPNTRRYVGEFTGKKTEIGEGAVRSPLWVHWPKKLKGGTVVEETVAAHIDLLPTLLDACDIEVSEDIHFDGRSLLEKMKDTDTVMAERPIVIQYHRGDIPYRYHNFMVRRGVWRLVHPSGSQTHDFDGETKFELYNLEEDPSELNDIAFQYPDVVSSMIAYYDVWFDDVTEGHDGPPDIIVDSEHENTTVLTWQDWIGGTWNPDTPIGYWKLWFNNAGRYDMRVELPFGRGIQGDGWTANLTIGDEEYEAPIAEGSEWAVFEAVAIPEGHTRLAAKFTADNVDRIPVHHVRVTQR